MLFPATILGAIATFAAVSIAIVIPREQKDGLYTQSLNEDGTLGEVVLLQEISARSENPASILSKRLPNPQISCSGYSMDKNAYGTAYNSLNSWCDAGNVVAPNSAIWWSSGSTIAYICNYGGNNPCSSGEFHDANVLIDTNCGTPNAGWVLINDWAKGYGRDNKGVNICSWGSNTS